MWYLGCSLQKRYFLFMLKVFDFNPWDSDKFDYPLIEGYTMTYFADSLVFKKNRRLAEVSTLFLPIKNPVPVWNFTTF